MKTVEIDPRLKEDTIQLGIINGQALLLMNNSLVPWFIVLPNTSETELYKLSDSERRVLEKNINILSEFILNNFFVEKLNVASIGNMVSQMHIHIVGRHKNDLCWPGVVWGQTDRKAYKELELTYILTLIVQKLGDSFTSG
ncbi:HIT family protein [Candidatus Persebacteraceae bacterium Df01]|jgi:diadenosine tetraphosphate (Ap4A) HIT family hydrolase|uniref:HIT family protein n=1 Tax=Candidatus Doriopsillibacter californiensis TaxID=2970740 RepID=A0ABT7QLC4_9GAMM|nr:HIT family protein [Candidatus Persebacteraceae bacterium Df01]